MQFVRRDQTRTTKMQTVEEGHRRKLPTNYLFATLFTAVTAAALGIAGGALGRRSTAVFSVSLTFAILLLALAVAVMLKRSVQSREVLGTTSACFFLGFVIFLALGVHAVVFAVSVCFLPEPVRLDAYTEDLCKPFTYCSLILTMSSIFWVAAALLTLHGRLACFGADALQASATSFAE